MTFPYRMTIAHAQPAARARQVVGSQLDTFAFSYLVTGSFAWAGSIVGVEAITKVIL
jgi:hypothetical protein